MSEIVIEPATARRFDDAQHALSGGGAGRSCQCQWWTITNAEFNSTTMEERRELLRDEMAQPLAPALIAYVDGEPAGWIRVGPRTAQPRLARTRAIGPHAAQPSDDPDVWAVTCFVVRREHRGIGLNEHLLAAAVDFAREHGARVVEGYPSDTSVQKRPSNELFRGVLTTFENVGFVETARPKPDRVVVTLELAAS